MKFQKYCTAVMTILLFSAPTAQSESVERTVTAQPESVASERVPGKKENTEVTDAAEGNEGVKAWFIRYDEIRRNAQMSPNERAKADRLKDGKLKLVIPGFARIQARKLLKTMIERYQTAEVELSNSRPPPETEKLHQGYIRFFREARIVFGDNLRLLSNPFAKGVDGKPLRKVLRQKKSELEIQESRVKELDARLRARYGIEPYRSQH